MFLFDNYVSPSDMQRLACTMLSLSAHDLSLLALTGGFAVEAHIHRRGGRTIQRPLHDIDFIASTFESIPETLGGDFLFNHIHPKDPPGKTLLQAVHRETAVRVDVFRACGTVMDRAVVFDPRDLRIVSITDLAARLARLCWDLFENKPVAPKFARDFLRLLEVTSIDEVELVWPDHRKPHAPETLAETERQLRGLIASRSNLLVPPVYSTDPEEICSRCSETNAFPLANPHQVLAMLGYR